MKRRGFTITELVVVIAVSSIVMTSVLSMVISISSYSDKQTERTDVLTEARQLEDELTSWYSGYDVSDNAAPTVSEDNGTLYIGSSEEYSSLAYYDKDDEALVLGSVSYATDYVTGVTFTTSEDSEGLVKCTFSYKSSETSGTYVVMLLKRSANA